MKFTGNPEPALREALAIDQDRLRAFAKHWIREYLDAGESRLAYDTFLFEQTEGMYRPSAEALASIGKAAEIMGIERP
jgi:hypothetical protein